MTADKTFDEMLLAGDEREEALAQIRQQISEWGLTMPAGELLPLHFGLNRFRQFGETEFWVANEKDAGYCGKFLFVFDGQTCPYHHHRIKHETFFVVKGAVSMIVDGHERILRQGDVLAMPPRTRHAFTGRGPALLLEASMPCTAGDAFFDDPNISFNGMG